MVISSMDRRILLLMPMLLVFVSLAIGIFFFTQFQFTRPNWLQRGTYMIYVALRVQDVTREITGTAIGTNVLLSASINMLELVLLPALAFSVGIIAAMLGIGGGVFIVPALQLLPLSNEFSPQVAAGTSLVMVLFTALSSTFGYTRQRRISYRVGLLLATVTIPGAFVGAYTSEIIPEELLILVFAIFLLYVASRMIFTYHLAPFDLQKHRKNCEIRTLVDSDGKVFKYVEDAKLGLPLSFIAGFFSGLLGIGGGAFMVSILHFVLCFPIHLAIATSAFTMIFTSTSGVATHLYLGNIRADYALILSIGVIFGAQIGAYVAKRISSKNLKRIFGVVLVLISLRMIFEFLGWA